MSGITGYLLFWAFVAAGAAIVLSVVFNWWIAIIIAIVGATLTCVLWPVDISK